MEYIKIRFGKNLEEMHSRLQRSIDDMFRRVNPMLIMPEQTWRPQIDIYETPEEIIIIGEGSRAGGAKYPMFQG
jgi:HSP20 family protein